VAQTAEGMGIRFDRVSKRYGGVVALEDVSFEVAEGSRHAICGENGAGKSTLARILAGFAAADSGRVLVDGAVRMVHQEVPLCDNLSVAENLCLSDVPARFGFVSMGSIRTRAVKMLDALEAAPVVGDVMRPVAELSMAQRQLVQIAGALASEARVLVLDEPTSSLTDEEARRLFAVVRALPQTVIYISHRMEEIFALCDTVTVLRDGRYVATRRVSEVTEDELVRMMLGGASARVSDGVGAAGAAASDGWLLRVAAMSSPGKFQDVSFDVRAGEIVGLAGLVGAGRTEVAEAIFGLDPKASGIAVARGRVGLVPEDRQRHGLIPLMSVRENVTLATSRGFWVRADAELALTERNASGMRMRMGSVDASVATLSGGNQQKVVLARWLAAGCRVLLLDEPTRGVDVGAKAEIHAIVREFAAQGGAVLLISSELPELLRLASRVLVMREGQVVGEFAASEASQESLLRSMTGLSTSVASPQRRIPPRTGTSI
jgi:ABC-type sugar transport system ATPase subunit